MTLQSHSWAYIQRKMGPENIQAPRCSLSTLYDGQDTETT